ncbi:hypothetical protein [Microcoleus sp. B9-D4]|uniref:hypothetical protein n=1 Tax=Microcoleus sp. B9-D4 TaxID=2818711 RepID=UPI002FD73CB6
MNQESLLIRGQGVVNQSGRTMGLELACTPGLLSPLNVRSTFRGGDQQYPTIFDRFCGE